MAYAAVLDRPGTHVTARPGAQAAVPVAGEEEPSSGYTVLFTDARDAYTAVIGSHVRYNSEGRIAVVEGDLTLLTAEPSYVKVTGHIYGGETLEFSEHGSAGAATASRHELRGIVGISEIPEHGLYAAGFYGPRKFLIPAMRRSPFPYAEMRKSELGRMSGLFDKLRTGSAESRTELRSLLAELFSRTGSDAQDYAELDAALLPAELRGYNIWPDLG